MVAKYPSSGYDFLFRLAVVGFSTALSFIVPWGCTSFSDIPMSPPEPAVSMASNGCKGMSLGTDFNGLVPFSPDNLWNQDVSSEPADPNSSKIIRYIGGNERLHPDFNKRNGIPYLVVDSAITPFVNLNLTDPSQSDAVPVPFPSGTPIEAGTDHHVLVVDRGTCLLYEAWEASYTDGQWRANNSAVWDLQNYNMRPYAWTSADAAGLPILPGLVRYDEALSGEIHHAFRFTLPRTTDRMVPPATHWAATNRGSPIPMGMRMRLKASFDISGFSRVNQVILTAMKKYGLILADNGSEMYVSGAPDERWSRLGLREWHDVKASDFEVVKMPPVMNQITMPSGPAPRIVSFIAAPRSTVANAQITLQWRVTGASYYYINPQVGFVRGGSVPVSPKTTTIYTLTATGPFGRTTATTRVTIK
jgi:hypothetical protein